MSSPRPSHRVLAALALVLTVAGCTGPSGADAVPVPPSPTPAAEVGTAEVADVATRPHVVTFSTEVDGPAGRSGLVEIRYTVVGERRHVVFDTPLGPMGEHVVTPGNHWFRLSATAAEPLGVPAGWIHVPIDELRLTGVDLPPALAEVRAPLPDPATVRIGDLVHGVRTVRAVEPVADGGTRLRLDDGRTVVVRRSPLPEDTTVEPPASAIDVRDVDDLIR